MQDCNISLQEIRIGGPPTTGRPRRYLEEQTPRVPVDRFQSWRHIMEYMDEFYGTHA